MKREHTASVQGRKLRRYVDRKRHTLNVPRHVMAEAVEHSDGTKAGFKKSLDAAMARERQRQLK